MTACSGLSGPFVGFSGQAQLLAALFELKEGLVAGKRSATFNSTRDIILLYQCEFK